MEVRGSNERQYCISNISQAYQLIFLVFLCACATKPQTNAIETESLDVSKRVKNKAVVRKYMDVRWSSNYRAVRAQTHSENYKEIRNELNLKI